MKRTFTFSFSRKVSTGPYENADVFMAEGFEDEDGLTDPEFRSETTDVIRRVRRTVDVLVEELRTDEDLKTRTG